MRLQPGRLATLMLLLVGLAVPLHAAFPTIIMIYGEPLSEPVFVTGNGLRFQRFSFLFDNYHASPTLLGELDERPYVSVAMFWGGRWVRYLGDQDRLTGLDRAQASQHGRLYPPTDNRGAVAVMTPVFTGAPCSPPGSGLGLALGVDEPRPVPGDAGEFTCSVQLTDNDLQALRETGIPGF